MNTFRFETNIISQEAVNKLKSKFEEFNTITDWKINIKDPQRILTVTSSDMNSLDIMKLVQKAGFRSNELKPFWKKTLKKLFTKDCCS